MARSLLLQLAAWLEDRRRARLYVLSSHWKLDREQERPSRHEVVVLQLYLMTVISKPRRSLSPFSIPYMIVPIHKLDIFTPVHSMTLYASFISR